MSLTDLESSLTHAIARSRLTDFGAEVARHAPGRRSSAPANGRPFPSLADLELNAFPPLRRTLGILAAGQLTRQETALDAEDREHVAWVGRVLDAMTSIADRFWGEVQTPVRCLFLDADDATPLPFQSTFMLPALRRPHPPALRGAAANAGVGGEDLRWLSSVWHAAQRTPAYRAALDAQRQLRGDDQAFRRLSETRDRTVSTRPQPRPAEILSSFAARSIEHFSASLGGLRETDAAAIRGLRAYNRLVHAALIAWLGGLEHHDSLPSIDPGSEAVTVDVSAGRFSVALTVRRSTGPEWLNIFAPFAIGLDSPLDGLYLTTAISIHGFGSFSAVDLAGDRLYELAEAGLDKT